VFIRVLPAPSSPAREIFLYGVPEKAPMGRGQVSVEYLVIVGIAIGLLIPAVLFFYAYSQTNEGTAVSSRVNEIGLQMVSTSKSAYALGVGSRQSLEFTMPEGITRVYVNGPELTIQYQTRSGALSEAVFFSNIALVTSFTNGDVAAVHPGPTHYRFVSQGGQVNITEVYG
jgi:uncharacterized protein (UPF0333 family)